MLRQIFMILLLFAISINGQYQVEYNEINGELTEYDKYEKDFGRYDGYEIPLYENETVNFIVYSEKFSPKLVFVTPNGNVFRQAQSNNREFASLFTTVNETGEWLLYVIGDSSAVGNYVLQYALASPNTIKLNDDANVCNIINYISAHSNAYFLLLENISDIKKSLEKTDDYVDVFFDEESGTFVIKLYEGNDFKYSETLLKDITSKVGNCISKSWSVKNENWKNINDYRVLFNSFVEDTNPRSRFIRIEFYDLINSKNKFTGNYVVQIVIGKN